MTEAEAWAAIEEWAPSLSARYLEVQVEVLEIEIGRALGP